MILLLPLSLFSFPSNPLWLAHFPLHGNNLPTQTTAAYLYYRPVVWLPQQLDDSWDTVVQPHGILGQFGILVAGGEVTQGADRWLSYILLLPSTKHGMDQRLYTTVLSHQSL